MSTTTPAGPRRAPANVNRAVTRLRLHHLNYRCQIIWRLAKAGLIAVGGAACLAFGTLTATRWRDPVHMGRSWWLGLGYVAAGGVVMLVAAVTARLALYGRHSNVSELVDLVADEGSGDPRTLAALLGNRGDASADELRRIMIPAWHAATGVADVNHLTRCVGFAICTLHDTRIRRQIRAGQFKRVPMRTIDHIAEQATLCADAYTALANSAGSESYALHHWHGKYMLPGRELAVAIRALADNGDPDVLRVAAELDQAGGMTATEIVNAALLLDD